MPYAWRQWRPKWEKQAYGAEKHHANHDTGKRQHKPQRPHDALEVNLERVSQHAQPGVSKRHQREIGVDRIVERAEEEIFILEVTQHTDVGDDTDATSALASFSPEAPRASKLRMAWARAKLTATDGRMMARLTGFQMP